MSADRKLWTASGRGYLGRVRQHHETWPEHIKRLRDQQTTLPVTKEQYGKLNLEQKAALKKELPWSIGAKYDSTGQRKKENLLQRDTANIDVDKQSPEAYAAVLAKAQELGRAYLHVSSASNEVNGLRSGRFIFPFSRSTDPDEFAAVSRKVAQLLGIEHIDPVSHRVNQVCFAPARCLDASMVFEEHAGPPLDVDATLGKYANWRDKTQWPLSSREIPENEGGSSRLGDPRETPGYRGAFCRAFDVLEAIEEFQLPFASTSDEWRWTPHGATGYGGARIYPPPNDPTHAGWLFNDHGSGIRPKRNSASYDLVRVYKFGDLDNDAPKDMPIWEMPSTVAMNAWIRETYPKIAADLKLAANAEFGNLDDAPEAPPASEDPKVELPTDQYANLVDRSDTGNANLLIRQAKGNLRYVVETKQWMRWTDESRWQLDEHNTFANKDALEVGKHYLRMAQQFEAAGQPDVAAAHRKWGLKCRNKSEIDAMLVQAQRSPGVPISVTELDSNPWLLGVKNGVVDLRTGVLRKTEGRGDYVTKRCSVPYNPEAKAPRWEKFIEEITGAPFPAECDASDEVIPGTVGRFTPRPALARYLQKALGYSLTGTTREHKFFIGSGGGSNGKNRVFDAVKRVLGGYARVLPSDALMATGRAADPERPTALAASLAGSRFVLASETRQDARLDVNVVKNNTGDSSMTARRLHQNPFEFTITHKIWLMTNNRPALDHIDDAIRGRLHLMPFDRKWNRPGEFERDPALPDGDKTLEEQLAAEDEGILRWLVEGALIYQQEDLNPPAEVVATTREYVEEQDHLGQWLATVQRCAPTEGSRAAELFEEFARWCRSQGFEVTPKTQTAFGLALGKRGIAAHRLAAGKHYGLRSQVRTWNADKPVTDPTTPPPAHPGSNNVADPKWYDSTPPAAEPTAPAPETLKPSKTNGGTKGAHYDPAALLMKGIEVGPKTAADLVQAGYTSFKKVAEAAPADLIKVRSQFTAEIVKELQTRARKAAEVRA